LQKELMCGKRHKADYPLTTPQVACSASKANTKEAKRGSPSLGERVVAKGIEMAGDRQTTFHFHGESGKKNEVPNSGDCAPPGGPPGKGSLRARGGVHQRFYGTPKSPREANLKQGFKKNTKSLPCKTDRNPNLSTGPDHRHSPNRKRRVNESCHEYQYKRNEHRKDWGEMTVVHRQKSLRIDPWPVILPMTERINTEGEPYEGGAGLGVGKKSILGNDGRGGSKNQGEKNFVW